MGVWKVKDGTVRRWGEKGTGCGQDGKRENAGWSMEGEVWDGGKLGREGNRGGRDGKKEDVGCSRKG